MISGENALRAISAFTNIRSPYSAANSFRNGLSSIVPFQASSYASSSGVAAFQNVSSAS